MNQPAMEQALGKLVIDGEFREAFFRDAAIASEAAGIALTDHQRSELTRIRPGALAAFKRYLDGKRIGDPRASLDVSIPNYASAIVTTKEVVASISSL